MKLSEILTLVLYRNVLNTCYVDNKTHQFNEDKLPAIITFLNESLLKLYSKFTLKVDSIWVHLQESRVNYPLTKEHIIPKWEEPSYDKYLWKGFEETFKDDVIKILDVYDNKENKLLINDPEELMSVYTPMYNILEVSSRFPTQVLNVTYQAAPDKIVYSPEHDTEVYLPDLLVGALVAYTNYLIFASIGSPASMQQAQVFLAEYQNIVDELIETDSINPQYSTNTEKFYKRGWC